MQLRRWQQEAIQTALDKYRSGQSHFLCLATPGAGKTFMASKLAQALLQENMIDLVVCFSPSINVAMSFQATLERCLQVRLDGKLGSKGRVLTYQSMLTLDSGFWELFSHYRILVIFDEIHHCAGDNLENANAWGQRILCSIQGRARYTLALTGTPWRSDRLPIVLASYCQQGQVLCDYQYGLQQAISDGVCRIPQITAIDNENIELRLDGERQHFSNFGDLLSQSSCTYQRLLNCDDLIKHVLQLASKKLRQLRRSDPSAGALIVAASVEHAIKIADILREQTGESGAIVTYLHDGAQHTIRTFRDSQEKWIISVGMISEGTDIPRLKICCHLTHVKTELYFRQVLGRVLRSNSQQQESGYLLMPAEPTLLEYARRISRDIPVADAVKIELMTPAFLTGNPEGLKEGQDEQEQPMPIMPSSPKIDDALAGISLPPLPLFSGSALSDEYDAAIGLYGKFRQQIFQMLTL